MIPWNSRISHGYCLSGIFRSCFHPNTSISHSRRCPGVILFSQADCAVPLLLTSRTRIPFTLGGGFLDDGLVELRYGRQSSSIMSSVPQYHPLPLFHIPRHDDDDFCNVSLRLIFVDGVLRFWYLCVFSCCRSSYICAVAIVPPVRLGTRHHGGFLTCYFPIELVIARVCRY